MNKNVNIGINEKERKEIADGLSQLLADTYILYSKTHCFHWNVTGPMFQTLHLMFEQHYKELFLAIDEIAERIRILGFFAPSSFKEFSKLSTIKDESEIPSAMKMIELLVEGHENVIKSARKILPLADNVHDEGTTELVTARISLHEKTAWMLRSLL